MELRKVNKRFLKRAAALLLAVLCVVGLIPVSNVSAADDTIELESFGKSENYHSAKLGSCMMHEMYFSADGRTITGFCADHGSKMSKTLVGQTWGLPTPITDPTVKVLGDWFELVVVHDHPPVRVKVYLFYNTASENSTKM